MDHIDEFESMFRRAEREAFQYAEVPLQSVAFVTDQSAEESARRKDALTKFMPTLQSVDNWRQITADQYSNVGQLVELLDAEQTDLIVTYRHLREEALVPQHSLGVFLDVLTQVTPIPVLVLPGSASSPGDISGLCDQTMVVADHISGDARLINYGSLMCPDAGTLWLCHVEDDAVFERYMEAIERIPEINSEQARVLLETTLLKESSDFIETCIGALQAARPQMKCESRVTQGHFLRQYTKLIEQNEIDLLVANTKDDDQLAMHGMAYSLSVELINTSMLLL